MQNSPEASGIPQTQVLPGPAGAEEEAADCHVGRPRLRCSKLPHRRPAHILHAAAQVCLPKQAWRQVCHVLSDIVCQSVHILHPACMIVKGKVYR